MRLAERLRRRLAEPFVLSEQWRSSDDLRWLQDHEAVPAAVLIAITDRPDPGVLLTLRNGNLRRHAGQVAFPGGRIDAEDGNPVAAALREAEEEIGLSPDQVDVVGEIEAYRTGTGYQIIPVVGVVPPDLSLTAHIAEVDAIFETPLAHLLDLANYAERETEWQGARRRYRETFWSDYRIWGATAAIMANLALRIGPLP